MGMTVGHRTIRARRGSEMQAKGWTQEAAVRMLMNNLDPEVAERPEDLVVYGGTGRAARDWPSFEAIVRTLENLGPVYPTVSAKKKAELKEMRALLEESP